ncbi:MAG: hypothetical protein M3R61_05320 [Chloroflexota bacterium]|nr:hypothetical protein [Chloroflexota bacterium]
MRRFRRFGDHTRWQPATFRALGVLIATIVCATLVARSTTSAHPASQNNLAAKQSFAVVLPVMVRLEAGQLFQAPVLGTTETPAVTRTSTATATAMPTTTPPPTPTTTASAIATNSLECEREIEQNLKSRLPAPNIGEVTNTSASCTYAVGLASYRMFDNNVSHQQLFSSQTALLGPGETRTFTVELPGCAYQLDLFYGPLIEAFDPQHGQIYGDRILITRVIDSTGFCVPGSTTPTIISTPNATPAGSPTSTPTSTESPMSTPMPTGPPTETETVIPT